MEATLLFNHDEVRVSSCLDIVFQFLYALCDCLAEHNN